MWYERAAGQDYPAGKNALAFMYARGLGVEKDEARAIALYREAAGKGDADAMFNLGILLEDGRGARADVAEAFRLYRAAAEKGHEGARRILERSGSAPGTGDFLDSFKRFGAAR